MADEKDFCHIVSLLRLVLLLVPALRLRRGQSGMELVRTNEGGRKSLDFTELYHGPAYASSQ